MTMRRPTKREKLLRLKTAVANVYAFIGYGESVPERKRELEIAFRAVYGCDVWDVTHDLAKVEAK